MQLDTTPESNIETQSRLCTWLFWTVIALLFITPLLRNKELFEPWFLKWSSVYLASAVASFYLAVNSRVAAVTGKLLYIGLAVIILRLFSFVITPTWIAFESIVNSICFLILLSFFLTSLKEQKISLNKLFYPFATSSLLISAIVLTQYFIFRVKAGYFDPYYFSGAFGNINMLSEYLLLTLPLICYFLRNSTGWKRNLSAYLMVTWLFIIFSGESRSALIAVGFWVILTFWRGISKTEFACTIVAASLFFIVSNLPLTTGTNKIAKAGSFSKRTEIYKGSLQMLIANPLGVGLNGYDYNFVPFQMNTGEKPTETLHYDNPHSEFLKWGIEGGWAGLIAQLALWAVIFWQVSKLPWKNDETFFAKASVLLLIPQLTFQFPFELGTSVFYLSFVLAFALRFGKIKDYDFNSFARVGTTMVSVLLAVYAATYSYSQYVVNKHQHDLEKLHVACRIHPSNTLACINYARALAVTKNPHFAHAVIKKELEQQPFQFIALKILSFTYFREGEVAKACEVGLVYSVIMSGVGPGPLTISQQCPGIQSPIGFLNPIQFREDYLQWLKQHLSTIR